MNLQRPHKDKNEDEMDVSPQERPTKQKQSRLSALVPRDTEILPYPGVVSPLKSKTAGGRERRGPGVI